MQNINNINKNNQNLGTVLLYTGISRQSAICFVLHSVLSTGNENEKTCLFVSFFFLIFISTLFYFTILYWFCHTLT